jgi:hypothetical protein
MTGLPQIDPLTVVVVFAIVLVLLIPLIGEHLGRLFEELFAAVGQFLLELAKLLERWKDAAHQHVKSRFTRHVPTQQAQTAPQRRAATSALAPMDQANPQRSSGYTDSSADAALLDEMGADEEPSAGAQGGGAQQHTAWAFETFVAEVVYLALLMAVGVSDLVFSAERVAVVLFNQPEGVNFGPLNGVRDLGAGLAGILFVGIGLLAGMMVFDYFDVLPKPAQLFPHISAGKRRVLLLASLLMLFFTAAAALLLFVLGQTIVRGLNEVFPIAEYVLVGTLGLALVGVVALSGWGAIRGIAAIGTLLLFLVGGVLAVVAYLFHAVANVILSIGRAGKSILTEIYLVFHRQRPRLRPQPQASSRLTVVGVGQHSSDFTAEVCEDISQLVGPSHLLAAGIYAQNHYAYDRATNRLQRAGIAHQGLRLSGPRHLSISPTQWSPVEQLAANIESTYADFDADGQRSPSPRHLVWIVDVERDEGNLLEQTVRLLRSWQQLRHPPVPGLTATVVCLLPSELPPEMGQSGVFDELADLAHPAKPAQAAHLMQPAQFMQPGESMQATRPTRSLRSALSAGQPPAALTITPSILILREVTEATEQIGIETARQLFARTLAASLMATVQEHNHGLLRMLARVRERGYPFAALSVDAAGVITARPRDGLLGVFNRRRGVQRTPFVNSVTARTEDISERLLEGGGAPSVRVAPDPVTRPPVAVLCLAPVEKDSPEYGIYRSAISRWFAERAHRVQLVDIMADSHMDGVDVSREHQRAHTPGERYCQVAYVYGIDSVETALGYESRPNDSSALSAPPDSRAPWPATSAAPTPQPNPAQSWV